jgi:cytochrome b pre-mRNA-processing protein 3
MFGYLLRSKAEKQAAQKLYETIVTQSRLPLFYESYEVVDSLDGRFDMISLHAALVIKHLSKGDKKAIKMSQALFDHLFVQMERALREMGVGDLAIPKHMKRMMKAFKGRFGAYIIALDAADEPAVREALRRNLYRHNEEVLADKLEFMKEYLQANHSHVMAQDIQSLCQGDVTFILPASIKGNKDEKHNAGMAA